MKMPQILSNLKNVSASFGVKWTVKNFKSLKDSIPYGLTKSPIFGDPAGQTRWILKLYPNGADEDSRGFIGVYLCIVDCEAKYVKVDFTIKLLQSNATEDCFLSLLSTQKFYTTNSWGWSQYCSRENLLKNRDTLLPDGNLTLQCSVEIKELSPERNTISRYSISREIRAKSHRDLTLVAKDSQEIRVHRWIMTTVSPVFAAMFEHDTREKDQNKVVIEDFEVNTLRLLVDYAYEECLDLETLSLDALENLFMASDKYQIVLLRKLCAVHLASCLQPSTATRLLAFSERFNLEQLYTQVLGMIQNKPLAVMTSSGWIDRQDELLKKALQTICLNTTEKVTNK